MKDCYKCAVNYIKGDEIADATNVLLNLYEYELFTFKVNKLLGNSCSFFFVGYLCRVLMRNNCKKPL